MTAPTENDPQPVPGHPGWARWRGKDGCPRAQAGLLRVQAHNDTVLLARIRRAEGFPVEDQIAELERLFPGAGWLFGTVWQSAGSGPDGRNLTAYRDGVLLAAADVPSLAEKVRREEGRMPG